MDVTIIKRAANGADWGGRSAVLMNRDPAWTGMNRDIILRDFTVDGNSANNTTPASQVGILMSGTYNVTYDHVRVKNVRGTRNCCGGEGFHFEFQCASGARFYNCEVLSDDGGLTASGFSCDKASDVEYHDCSSTGMTYGMGFTMWKCNDIRYFNCSAYRNNSAGFHTEWSYDVLYEDCITDGGSRWTYAGISPTSSYNVTIRGLLSLNNKHGVYVTDAPGGHPINLSISDSTIINCRRAGIWLPNANKNKPISIWDITMQSVPHPFYVKDKGYMSLAAGLRFFKPKAVN
jgi:hypothetical protein